MASHLVRFADMLIYIRSESIQWRLFTPHDSETSGLAGLVPTV
jgi:hypothetical protein